MQKEGQKDPFFGFFCFSFFDIDYAAVIVYNEEE